jgi:hypothetical protein
VKVSENGELIPSDLTVAMKQAKKRLKRAERSLRQARFKNASLFALIRKRKLVQSLSRELYLLQVCAEEPTITTSTWDDSSPCELSAKADAISATRSYDRIIDGRSCSPQSSVVELTMYNQFGIATARCSGTVIGARVVLTAAHCLEGQVGEIVVTANGARHQAAFFEQHPGFESFINNLETNDVAIVVTKTPLNIPAVRVHQEADLVADEVGIIMGYGEDASGISGILRGTLVSLLYFTESAIFIEYRGTATQFGNTCSGDSGGPLLVKRNGSYQVAGVTSSGLRWDCGAGDISGFAKVSNASNLTFINTYLPSS